MKTIKPKNMKRETEGERRRDSVTLLGNKAIRRGERVVDGNIAISWD